jgi:CheY-like chemotaxis protein
MMPLMNGPQMIVKLKKDPELQNIPVLILTSRADNESRIRGIDIGADNYLSKPFKFQELLSNIFNLIELKENEKKLNNANKDLKEKQSAIQNLLENLGQGFLIFDKKGVVQPGCSEVTKEFFGVDPTHKFFYDVISLSDERKNIFTRWIKNLWKGHLSFKDMLPLAPKFYQEENKYIHLNYRPIYKEGKKVEKVICVATDKTQERNLENKTKEEKEKVQMILKIIKDPLSFQDILDTSYTLLNIFETELKKEPQEINITYLFRKIHTLKALFASFSIPKIPFEMHKFEDYLSEVREQKKLLSSKVVNEINHKIKNIYSLITSFTKKNRLFLEKSAVKLNLGKKTISNEDILEVSQIIESTLGSDHHLYKNYVDEFILESISVNFFKMSERFEKLAYNKNKLLKFHIKTTLLKIRQDHYISFFETITHLFNFLINYDLEIFQEREILGKEKTGRFDISFFKGESDHIKILITSDGKGLDETKIEEYTKIKSLSSLPRDLLKIFKSNDLYNILGTNISQDILGIHHFIEEVEKLEGTLKIMSYPQKGLSFEVTLPFLQ